MHFSSRVKRNVSAHRQPGYAAVTLTLKVLGVPRRCDRFPAEALADLADRFSFSELRVTHEQNVVLADVREDHLFELWQSHQTAGVCYT